MLPIMRQIINGTGIITRGLVAHYDFVQGSDADVLYQKSGIGTNGRLGSAVGADTNDPSWGSEGLTFGADDYVDCGACSALQTGSGVTLFLTIKRATGGNANASMFGNLGANPYPGCHLQILSTTTGSCQIESTGNNTAFTLPINEWHTVCGVFSMGILRAVVDGIVASEKVPTAFNPVTGSNLILGKIPITAFYAPGVYAYALAYNRALSLAEIKQNTKAIKSKVSARGVALP